MRAHKAHTACFLLLLFVFSIHRCAHAATDTTSVGEKFEWPTNFISRQPPKSPGMDFLVGIEPHIVGVVRRGQIFPIPVCGALFFKTKDKLEEFKTTGQPMEGIDILPASHVVKAMTEISDQSAGGEIYDPSLGQGYILIIPNSNAYGVLSKNFMYIHEIKTQPFRIGAHNEHAVKIDRSGPEPLVGDF